MENWLKLGEKQNCMKERLASVFLFLYVGEITGQNWLNRYV